MRRRHLFITLRACADSRMIDNPSSGIVKDITFLNDGRYPRGMRNNNPGNIRANKRAKWKGRISDLERRDRSFEQFAKYWLGVRALIVLLGNYYYKHNLTTIEKIINRYAPSVENQTESYVSKVCRGTGFKARQIFVWNRDNVKVLVSEICRHENGRDPLISDNLFAAAWLDLIEGGYEKVWQERG